MIFRVQDQCHSCQWHEGGRDERRCRAFPGGIPDRYWNGDQPHDQPVNGYAYLPPPQPLELPEGYE